MEPKRQFKNPHCPAALTARYAQELKTKRSLKTGKPLTDRQLAWRSGILYIRNYEANWHNAVVKKYGNASNNVISKSDDFIQHNFDNFDYDSLYDDMNNVKLTK